jgi:hypothetical protein
MRNVDHLVLASYERPARWRVLFADGVEVMVWASNERQANVLAIKKRESEQPGRYYPVRADKKMGARLKSKNFTDVAEFLRESISDEDLKERLEIVKKEFAGDQDFWRGLYDVRRGKLSLQMAKHPICDYKATRGILPWKEGDEPAEDSIRRLRGGES